MSGGQNASQACRLKRFKGRRVFSYAVLLGILVLVLIARPATYAFTTGQGASLVLGQSSFTTSTETVSQTGLYGPEGAGFDSHGNLWVADRFDGRVLEFTCTTTGCTNGNNATLVLGQPDFTTTGSPVSQAALGGPEGLGFDSQGNLWVADRGFNRVLEYTCTATSSCVNGNTAALVLGQPDFTTDTATTSQTGLRAPVGVAFDSQGDLWIADDGNSRVLEYTCTATGSCVNGNAAALVLGQTDFTSRKHATSQTGLHAPQVVVFDSQGNLWVADQDNNRTLEYSPPFSDGMPASLVLGQPDFTTGIAATSQTGLYRPTGVGFDSQDDLWVADFDDNRLLEYACTTTGCTNGNNATLVLGQPDFATDTAATSQTELTRPYGVVFDSEGNLWVTDFGNNRVLEYTSPAASTPTQLNVTVSSVVSPSTQTSASSISGVSGIIGTFSPITLLLVGVAVVLVVLLAVVMLRRPKPPPTRSQSTSQSEHDLLRTMRSPKPRRQAVL